MASLTLTSITDGVGMGGPYLDIMRIEFRGDLMVEPFNRSSSDIRARKHLLCGAGTQVQLCFLGLEHLVELRSAK